MELGHSILHEGIVLGHIISYKIIKVDKGKGRGDREITITNFYEGCTCWL